MFGIDGIEFLIILIVIVVVVGPKDLPKMMRAFGQATARMRRTAAEFRRHFDEAMREAELGDLADTVKQAQKLDPRKKLTEIFDPIREVGSDIQASLREQVSMDVQPPEQANSEQKDQDDQDREQLVALSEIKNTPAQKKANSPEKIKNELPKAAPIEAAQVKPAGSQKAVSNKAIQRKKRATNKKREVRAEVKVE